MVQPDARTAPKAHEAMGRVLASPGQYAGDPSRINFERIIAALQEDGWTVEPPPEKCGECGGTGWVDRCGILVGVDVGRCVMVSGHGFGCLSERESVGYRTARCSECGGSGLAQHDG